MYDFPNTALLRTPPLATPPGNSRPVDTNGWDTVSAVTIADMNAAIRAAGTSPEDFSAVIEGEDGVTGAFEPWEIAPDGDGRKINLAVPMRNLSVTYMGRAVALPMATATVRVELEYLPAGPRMMTNALGDEQEVETHLLVIKTHLDSGMLTADPDAKVARVVGVTGKDELGTRHYAALKYALDQWFNDNLAAFQHVFATVNIARIVHEDTEGFEWMRPSAVSYAFGHNTQDPDASVLAILCQTGGRDADGLFAQVQADMIPTGANAAICISKARVMRDMLAKGIPLAFDGLEEKHLAFSPKSTGISLKAPVQLGDVEDEESGKTYQPELTRLNLTLRDTDLKIESETDTIITVGVHSICSAIGTYSFGLAKNDKGEKTIAFKELDFTKNSMEKTDPAASVWEWVIRGLTLVGMILLGFLSGGTLYVVAAITAALAIGSITRDGIKLTEGNNGPPIDPLLSAANLAVNWSTAARFDPTFAGLNGGLHIGGIMGGDVKRLGAAPAQAAFQAPFADLMAARAQKVTP